jgi:membrane protein DedA with SNARE-associated domain
MLRAVGLMGVVLITLTIAANRDRLPEFAALGYAGAFLAMLVSNATLVLPAPGLIIVFVLGTSLNPFALGAAAGLGAALGEMTGYFTGYTGLTLIEESAIARRVQGWMNRNGRLTIFALSVIPNPFFDLAGLMAGAGRMPVWQFLIIAFLGKAIQGTGIAFAGMLSLGWVEQWLRY